MIVREQADVVREAQESKTTIQLGRIHPICVEENFELPCDHASRKFKGRVVFLGNQVKNQDFEKATFMDLGNSPAYIQAELGGDDCWISLPFEAYPQKVTHLQQDLYEHPDALRAYNEAVHKWQSMRNPVTILLKALYGHPDSVTMWEVKCASDVKSVGFGAIGAEWPSMYFTH